MWRYYNPNPESRQTGDCTLRALTLALGDDWDMAYARTVAMGYIIKDMQDCNAVWGAVLHRHGFHRYIIPDDLPDNYTVRDFCRDHPRGVYVLALSGHVVTVIDGDYYDTWDSGGKIPLYYWIKEDTR